MHKKVGVLAAAFLAALSSPAPAGEAQELSLVLNVGVPVITGIGCTVRDDMLGIQKFAFLQDKRLSIDEILKQFHRGKHSCTFIQLGEYGSKAYVTTYKTHGLLLELDRYTFPNGKIYYLPTPSPSISA